MANIKAINNIMPEVITKKDVFGGDLYFIPADILTKRKAWNLCLKRGFKICPNKQFLKYTYNNIDIYAKNNLLSNVLFFEITINKTD